MRTFIAIEISEGMREALGQAQSHLRYAGADVKWVETGNIHLTLKFLGEVHEEKVEKIKSILDSIARDMKPFALTLNGIGAFPKIAYPRVIWVGLYKGAAESKVLAERIDDALSKIGFQKEARPFASHLTIGRVRSSKNLPALKEKIQSLDSQLSTHNSQLTTHIILFKSTLTPNGPIYTKLHESRLAG
jgi:2'-5' RNA ligase